MTFKKNAVLMFGLFSSTLYANTTDYNPYIQKKPDLEALDVWQFQKDQPWLSIKLPRTETYVLHNRRIKKGQTSTFYQVLKGNQTIEFKLKTEFKNTDYLVFYINGIENLSIKKSQNFKSYRFQLPNQDQVKISWRYHKQSRSHIRAGGVWLDGLKLSGSQDSDQDGLNDLWEYKYFKKLDYLADDDLDEDGVSNYLEQTRGLSPVLSDSDGDSYLDGFEMKHHFNPNSQTDNNLIEKFETTQQSILFNTAIQLFNADPRNHKIALKRFQAAADQGSTKAAYMVAYMHEFGLGTKPNIEEAFQRYTDLATTSASARVRLCNLIFNDEIENESPESGLKHCEIAAEMGHPGAQVFLASAYFNEIHFEHDLNQAWYWYQKAATQGDARAQYAVGFFLLHGLIEPANQSKAIQWFERAAAQNFDQAHIALGNLWLDDAEGITKHAPKALAAYQAAAAQNNASGFFNQYLMYAQGLGIPQNKTLAMGALQKAADLGYIRAIYHVGLAYWDGKLTDKNLSKSHLYILEAANQGFALAQTALGQAYYEGAGVTKNLAEAIIWFKKAAVQGEVEAQNTLGWIHFDEENPQHSEQEAFRWFEQGAEQSHPASLFGLYLMYRDGLYVEPSASLAQSNLEAAADAGHAEAQLEYGIQLYDTNTNAQRAYAYILKAAEQDDHIAQYNLAYILCVDEQLPVDYPQAAKWIKRAMANGYPRTGLYDYLKGLGYL